MSAFIVGHDHIDALLSFACDLTSYSRIDGINTSTATKIGKMLLAENERSVGYRYNEDNPDDMPGTIGQTSRNYKYRYFRLPAEQIKKCVWVLHGCSCFDYQACETPDYEQSEACKLIDKIRRAAIRALPHYDNAPWEIRREREPMVGVR